MANLLMSVPRNKRHIDFRRLTGSQRTPRDWGVTNILWLLKSFRNFSNMETSFNVDQEIISTLSFKGHLFRIKINEIN